MVLFVLIAFAVANIFITNFFYKIIRKLGTSHYEKAKEELLMSRADVAYKKTSIWAAIYVLSAVVVGSVILASCSEDESASSQYHEQLDAPASITDSKQFIR